jgi:hypothetical protein
VWPGDRLRKHELPAEIGPLWLQLLAKEGQRKKEEASRTQTRQTTFGTTAVTVHFPAQRSYP